jgi:hypothetical protein
MSQLHLIAHAGGQVRNALPLLHEYITTRSLLDDEPVQAVARGVSSEVHQQLQARPDATHAWARLEDATAEIERCAMLLRFVVGETVEVQPAEQRALTALADLRSAVAAQVTWLPPRHEGTACVSQRVRQALHLRYLQPSERLHDAELTGIAMGWSAGLGSALMETMEGAHREMTGHSR